MIGTASRIAAAAILIGATASGAGAQQFEQPYSFTPRDTRVAIALVIHQVEDPEDVANSSTFIDQSSINCSVPSGNAEAVGNGVCNIIRGDQNAAGTQNQTNTGDQDADTTNNNSPSGVDAIEAALSGN